MSWHKLNHFELQAARKSLMLDASEAAECIGKVSTRSWQRWESGDRSIPSDIDEEVYALVSQMNECIDGVLEAGEDQGQILWYHVFENAGEGQAAFIDHYPGHTKAWWKVHQAVCSWLFNNGGDVELINSEEADCDSYIFKFFSRTREHDIEYKKQEELLGNIE